jgi:hypothetical protein
MALGFVQNFLERVGEFRPLFFLAVNGLRYTAKLE